MVQLLSAVGCGYTAFFLLPVGYAKRVPIRELNETGLRVMRVNINVFKQITVPTVSLGWCVEWGQDAGWREKLKVDSSVWTGDSSILPRREAFRHNCCCGRAVDLAPIESKTPAGKPSRGTL